MSLFKKFLSSNLTKYEDEQKRRYKNYMKISKKQAKVLEKSEAEVYQDHIERQRSLRASKRQAPQKPNDVVFKEPSEGLSLGPAPAVLEASNRYVVVEALPKEYLTELEKLHLPNFKEHPKEQPQANVKEQLREISKENPKETLKEEHVYENVKKEVIPNGSIPENVFPTVPRRKKWKGLSQENRNSEPIVIYQNLVVENRKSFPVEEINSYPVYNVGDIILRDNVEHDDNRIMSTQSDDVFYDCETPQVKERNDLESFQSIIEENASPKQEHIVHKEYEQPYTEIDSTVSKQDSAEAINQEEPPAFTFVSKRASISSTTSSTISSDSSTSEDDAAYGTQDMFLSSSDEGEIKEELRESFNKYVMKPKPQEEDAPSMSTNQNEERRIERNEQSEDSDYTVSSEESEDSNGNIEVKQESKYKQKDDTDEEGRKEDEELPIRSSSFVITKEKIKFDDDEEVDKANDDNGPNNEDHETVVHDSTQELSKVIYLKDFRKKSDDTESSDTTDEEATILDGNQQLVRRLSDDIDGLKHYEHHVDVEDDVFEPRKQDGKKKVYFDFANSYCSTYEPVTEESATSETSTTDDDEDNYVTFSFNGYDNDSYLEFLKNRNAQVNNKDYLEKDKICMNFGVGSSDLKNTERQQSSEDMDVAVLNCKSGYDQSKADFSTEEELDQFSDDCSLDLDVTNQNKFQNYYDNIGEFNGESSEVHAPIDEFNLADVQADLDEIKKLDDVVTQIDKIQDILTKITGQVETLESKDNENYTGLLKTLLSSMKILGGLDCHFDEELLEFQQRTLLNIRGCIETLKDK